MENKKKNAETTNSKENNRSWFVANINTCIACGRGIPEGMLVCMECEIGKSKKDARYVIDLLRRVSRSVQIAEL